MHLSEDSQNHHHLFLWVFFNASLPAVIKIKNLYNNTCVSPASSLLPLTCCMTTICRPLNERRKKWTWTVLLRSKLYHLKISCRSPACTGPPPPFSTTNKGRCDSGFKIVYQYFIFIYQSLFYFWTGSLPRKFFIIWTWRSLWSMMGVTVPESTPPPSTTALRGQHVRVAAQESLTSQQSRFLLLLVDIFFYVWYSEGQRSLCLDLLDLKCFPSKLLFKIFLTFTNYFSKVCNLFFVRFLWLYLLWPPFFHVCCKNWHWQSLNNTSVLFRKKTIC